MGVELEIKFQATPAQQLALRAAYPGDEETIAMETTYYDTANGALSDRHYTLRRRTENQRSVCTLKTPVSGFGRGEFDLCRDSIEAALPELCKLSGVDDLLELTGGGVIPVCGAKFTRIAKTLVLPEATVELALDTGILSGGGKEIPLCEIEVELKEGSWDAAIAFARDIASTYRLTPEKASKFRRALALAKGESYGTA